MALFSCAGGAGGSGNDAEVASLAINTSRAVDNKYAKDAIVTFTVTISSGSFTSTKTANKGETLIFSSLPVGTYSVKAYGKTSNGNIAAKCETSVKIVAGETKTTTLKLARLEYCTVKFFNGTTEINSVQVTNGYKVSKPADLTPETGHTFSYWGTSSNATTSFDFNTPITSDLNIYGVFDVIKYDITFDYNGGAIGSATSTVLKVAYSSAPDMTKVATPEREDSVKGTYEFLGWAETDDAENGSMTLPAVTGEKTYYAVWKPKYKITFDYQGGTVGTDAATSKDVYVDKNANIPIPTAPTKTGFKFKGWAVSSSATTADYGTTETTAGTATADKTLYAVWLTCYTITYVSEPVEITETNFSGKLSYTSEEGLTLPVPSKNGLEFKGWYPNATFTGSPDIAIGVGAEGPKTYYAKWVAKVHLYRHNDSADSTIDVVYNKTFASLSIGVPTKTGATFKGWYKCASDTITSYPSSAYNTGSGITEETYLHAKWEYTNFTGTVEDFLLATFTSTDSSSPHSVTITGASTAEQITQIGKHITTYMSLDLSSCSATVIPENAFTNTKITSIRLPSNLEELGRCAFVNCHFLQGNIVIPATCNKIGCLIFNSDYSSRITVSYEGSHSWKAHKMGTNATVYENLSSPPTSSQISGNYYSFYVWR